MATPQGPPPDALGQLQAMVNLVLMQTGHLFKDPKKAASVKTQWTLKRAIPAAVDRFHDSLDELEDEIHRAQAVFRRDLAVIRADRVKREQAEAAERQRVAAAVATDKPHKPADTRSKPDDVMQGLEDLLTDPTPPAKEKAPDPAPPPEPAKQEPPMDAPPISAPAPPPVPIDTSAAPAPDPLFDATPTTANLADTDFDFDSMFNDEPTGQPDSVAQNDTSNDLQFDLGGDDGQSLLRGLEDFANSTQDNVATTQNTVPDTDFSMLDIPAVSAAEVSNAGPQDILAAVTEITSAPPPQDALPAQNQQVPDELMDLDTMDNNFEDLFEWGDNQEGTQFEDQFMDFGD